MTGRGSDGIIAPNALALVMRAPNTVRERRIMEKKSALRRITDKLYGGIDLTWPKLILYAAGTAVLTAVLLTVPVFKGTSFARMGETLEAWIFFAVIVMANCKKPLESALKTFVFFLISQPLIYLLQVPFSWQGWGLFRYYKFWFILTLFTFPAAYIGWYIKKRNWLSLIILLPVMCLLAYMCKDGMKHVIYSFPNMLIMVLFCVLQVLLYLYVFTEKISQKLIGLAVPAAFVAVMLLMPPNADFSTSQFLPNSPALTENAVAASDDTGIAEIAVTGNGADSTVRIRAHAYGATTFTVKDGEKEYRYRIRIYEEELGTSRVEITPE